MAKISAGVIKGLIVSVIFATVLFSMMPDLIPNASEAVYNYFAGLTNTTIYGTSAVTFAGNVPSLLGWFWVAMPFILAITLVSGLFVVKSKRGRRR